MKKIYFLLIVGLVFFSLAGLAHAQTVTFANPLASIGVYDFQTLITKIISYLSGVVGAVATLMLVIAGIMFIASGGSQQTIGTAKKIAMYAVIGMAMVLAAEGLVGIIQTFITPASIGDIPNLIARATTYVSVIAGALVTLMFVIAGVLFIISGGNPGKVDTSKKIAIYAVIGAVLVLAADGLVALVVQFIR